MGGAREAHSIWHLELQFLSRASHLIYHLLPLSPSFQRHVKDRCKPYFLGSPFSQRFGRHLFSLPNRIIFLTPLWRLSSSLNIQVQEAIFFSLCTWFVSLWSQARIHRNEEHGKETNSGVGEERDCLLGLWGKFTLESSPSHLILQGKNNASLIWHCPPCSEDSKAMCDCHVMCSCLPLKSILHLLKWSFHTTRTSFARGNELSLPAIPI